MMVRLCHLMQPPKYGICSQTLDMMTKYISLPIMLFVNIVTPIPPHLMNINFLMSLFVMVMMRLKPQMELDISKHQHPNGLQLILKEEMDEQSIPLCKQGGDKVKAVDITDKELVNLRDVSGEIRSEKVFEWCLPRYGV